MEYLQNVNWVDAVLIGVVVISALVGLMRGLIREIFSFFAWSISLFVAWKFADQIAQQYVIKFIDDKLIAYITAFGVLFLISLFVIGLVNMLITSFIKATGLGGFDRILGLLFGVIRGIVFSALIVFFGSMFADLKESDFWKNSKYVPGFLNIDTWMVDKIDATDIKNKILLELRPDLYGVLQEAPDASNTLQSLDTAVSPQAQPVIVGHEEGASTSISLTSLQIDEVGSSNNMVENGVDATRPQIDAAQQQQQAQYSNALTTDSTGNNADGITLESMSDLTIDQNTDHLQPDSDDPNENIDDTDSKSNGIIPDAPTLQLESTQDNNQ